MFQRGWLKPPTSHLCCFSPRLRINSPGSTPTFTQATVWGLTVSDYVLAWRGCRNMLLGVAGSIGSMSESWGVHQQLGDNLYLTGAKLNVGNFREWSTGIPLANYQFHNPSNPQLLIHSLRLAPLSHFSIYLGYIPCISDEFNGFM